MPYSQTSGHPHAPQQPDDIVMNFTGKVWREFTEGRKELGRLAEVIAENTQSTKETFQGVKETLVAIQQEVKANKAQCDKWQASADKFMIRMEAKRWKFTWAGVGAAGVFAIVEFLEHWKNVFGLKLLQ